MNDLNAFFKILVCLLKSRDVNALDELAKSYEDSNDLEILHYLWLLYHPEGIPYIDDELTEIYKEISDIGKANKYGKLCFDGYKKLCDQGKSEYMSRLGELYLEGCGCNIDKNQADYWFKKASETKGT